MRLLFRLPLLLCLVIVSFFGWHSLAGIKKTANAFEFDAGRRLWSRLTYRAKSFLGEVTTDVHMTAVPVEEVAGLLITTPGWEALQPSRKTVLALTVYSKIDPFFGSEMILKTQSWFEPNGAAALQRIRLRQGKDKWQKSYRFTKKGVYRLRKKPQDSGEENLPVDQWTKIADHFYAYADNALKCRQILEPASLLYIVSAIDLRSAPKPVSLCVFNKKKLFMVNAHVGDSQSLKVNYVQKLGNKQTRIKKNTVATKISFQPVSLASEDPKSEEFSFMGLKGDFNIFVDSTYRIPIKLSGRIAAIGKLDIVLQEVIITQTEQ